MAPQDITHVDTMFKRMRRAQNIMHYSITIPHYNKMTKCGRAHTVVCGRAHTGVYGRAHTGVYVPT